MLILCVDSEDGDVVIVRIAQKQRERSCNAEHIMGVKVGKGVGLAHHSGPSLVYGHLVLTYH